jgi:hypothetical protein
MKKSLILFSTTRSVNVLGMAVFVLFGGLVSARAVQWSWEWMPDAAETSPTVTVCPFKYDKKWAYTIEIDDGLVEVAQAPNLVTNYKYSDAPPGVVGGSLRSVVGSAAPFVKRVAGNSSQVTFPQLRQMMSAGWGVSSHSYAHSGSGTMAQIREDHFWSQNVFATEVGQGRGLSHFVYPNGWLGYEGYPISGGYDGQYFTEFGFRSGSLQGGSSMKPYAVATNVREFKRNNLDGLATSDPYRGLPATIDDLNNPLSAPSVLEDRLFVIDFTHVLEISASSDNYQAWALRLERIAGTTGVKQLWSAPSAEIFDYVAAQKVATATVQPGRVRLSLPETAPGAALTLKLTNIPVGSVITAPPGGVLYRSGTTVWLTTPFLGQAGTTLPLPRVKRIYQANLPNATGTQTIPFGATYRVAAVQVHQQGDPPTINVDLNLAAGGTQNFSAVNPAYNFGDIDLFSAVPATAVSALPQATGLNITTDASLKDVAIWVVDETMTNWTAWQSTNFTSGEISNGVAADMADFDGDGLSNLMEYALGTPPKQANAHGLPAPVVDANGYLKMVFSRDASKPDVTYTVESCSDLSNAGNWSILAQSAGGAPTVNNGAFGVSETGNGNVKTVTVFDSRLSSGLAKRFMRLKVSH